jgi:hypothetical protein
MIAHYQTGKKPKRPTQYNLQGAQFYGKPPHSASRISSYKQLDDS